MSQGETSSVVPAQLAFLAIYNPSLGPTDDTIGDQVVFHTSRSSRFQRLNDPSGDNDARESKDDWNEKLREIGLAQGMVSFAK